MWKLIFGILMFFGSIALGIYVGLWLMFIGGIVEVVDGIQAMPMSGIDIALGIVRMMFAGLAAWISVVVLMLPSFVLIAAGLDDIR